MKALVTDGDQRPALAVVRSLGRRGVSVVVGEEQRASLAASSRYCARRIAYPSPYRHADAFKRFLIDFIAHEKVDVVMPITDVTTHAVASIQDGIRRHSAVAVPSCEAFEIVTDKHRLLQRAAHCGVPIPRTHFVDSIVALKQIVSRVEYPAVVKPARSRIRTDTGWLPASVHYASCEHDLWRLYEQVKYLRIYPSLIQERIVGPGVGVFGLFDHGRMIAAFSHRRLREKPPAGGVSVLRESIAIDPRLEHYATRMLGPLGWHGVAMMEYKQDHRTGNVYLIEVNGRFWGSLQLAIDAGVDFPYFLYRLALGESPDTPRGYTVGVRSRWLLGDLDHLLLRLFKSEGDLDLPPSAPSKFRVLVDFLEFVRPGLHYEVISGDDARPFLYELQQYVKALFPTFTRTACRRAAVCSGSGPQTQSSREQSFPRAARHLF
jgi:predicted ATP-grasp superfamily ATP-dependent carboligase